MVTTNTYDLKRAARRRLPKMVYDYVEGGADDEKGLVRNPSAFDAMTFTPRRLVDVSERSTQTSFWGQTYEMPVYVSPTGLNGLLWPKGDAALARAAGDAGIPFALSTASNMSIEDIADIATGDLWFQLYVLHRDIAKAMCDRAWAAGYRTLILTVDVPLNGNRERDLRNAFGVPAKISLRTLFDGALHPAWSLDLLRHGIPKLRNFETLESVTIEAQAALMRREMDASFDFDALAWLREIWPGKLIVKGLAQETDVHRCARLGVDAAILSNHGGRQIDSAASATDSLMAFGAAPPMPVFVDGGVMRGSDIAKSLCLGASMVGLGRVLLYALAAHGEDGVRTALTLLKSELDREQAMLGAPHIADLAPELILKNASKARSNQNQSTGGEDNETLQFNGVSVHRRNLAACGDGRD